jgi:GNAT superfamily N-acetyltransferase
LAENHLDAVVDIHLRAFPSFFLSFLGPRFLREFYANFVHDPCGIAFVAREGERLLGAVVGAEHAAGFYKRLLAKRWWAFCFASLNALRRRPLIGLRLVRAVLYRGDVPRGVSGALFSSIAVSPEAQGLGVGRLLVARWLSEAKRRGVSACYLTTDAERNNAVNRFYVQGGWKLDSVIRTPEGRKMNRYVYSFAGQED